MDILAHALWGWAILKKSGKPLLVVLASLLPDLLSFGPHMVGSMLNRTLAPGKPALHTLSPYVFHAYDFTHSILSVAVVFTLISLIQRSIPLWLYAWPIHVIIDIPTHSMDFFPTPFLWPLSDYRFDGISWATPWFLIANYSLLAITYVWLYTRNGKNPRARRRQAEA